MLSDAEILRSAHLPPMTVFLVVTVPSELAFWVGREPCHRTVANFPKLSSENSTMSH